LSLGVSLMLMNRSMELYARIKSTETNTIQNMRAYVPHTCRQ